ncbi:hypothetical protein TWF694_010226 [Orbilia ellipsospora]|uniref:F-box domain-containing protein n=1 Tax=Orbilia ellipsospora TaxID=2528407 RepID=A0AAV9X9N4_9PEZI
MKPIPYLPNEVMGLIFSKLINECPEGCHLEDASTRQTVISCTHTSQRFRSLVIRELFNKLRLSSGYFPCHFEPSLPNDWSENHMVNANRNFQDEFKRRESFLKDQGRSNYFLKFNQVHYLQLRRLTVEVSCTIGDTHPSEAEKIHQTFATAIMKCENLTVLKLHCHAQCRLDRTEQGLGAFFSTWEFENQPNSDIRHRFQVCIPTVPDEKKRRKGTVFPKLRELKIASKSGVTKMPLEGAQNLWDFVERHRDTLEILEMDGVGVQTNSKTPFEAQEVDGAVAKLCWEEIKHDLINRCMRTELIKKLSFTNVLYTVVRKVPSPNWTISHFRPHNLDWPYESDVILTSNHLKSKEFEIAKYRIACGCELQTFVLQPV